MSEKRSPILLKPHVKPLKCVTIKKSIDGDIYSPRLELCLSHDEG